MCDFSLMEFPNRLAREGEDLIVYKFRSGTIGLVSANDLRCRLDGTTPGPKGFWAGLRRWLFEESKIDSPLCAICLPPGAGLEVDLITAAGRAKTEARFEQIGCEVGVHRDSLRFANGQIISLQMMFVGTAIKVLSLSGSEREPWPQIPAYVEL